MSRGNNCHGESCHLGYEKPWLQILYTTLYRIQSRSVTQSIPSLQKIAPGGVTADITTPILPDLISANQTKRDTKGSRPKLDWALLRIFSSGVSRTSIQANSDVQVWCFIEGRDKMAVCPWVWVGHHAQSQVVKSCNPQILHNSVGFEDSLYVPIVTAL